MAEKFFDFQFDGIEQLAAAFDELGAALSKQVLQAALKKAAEPVADEGRSLAPRGTGTLDETGKHLADSIVIRTALPKNQRRLRAKAGVEKQFAEAFVFATAPHAHLVEFGHRIVARGPAKGRLAAFLGKTELRVIGHAPAHPFMRPAWDAKKDVALGILKAEVWKQLESTAKRLAKQAATGKLSRKSALSLASSIEAEGD